MKKRRVIFRTAFVLFMVYAVSSLIVMQVRISSAQTQLYKLRQDEKNQQDVNNELKNKIDKNLTPEYIEQIARERLGLHKPGQVIFQDISS